MPQRRNQRSETAPARETPLPESQVREAQVPESQVPESQVPESPIREAQVPESQVRESQVRETSVPEAPNRPPLRRLDDPTAMRALAHPVRLDLLEALLLEGELTATQAGDLIGESPASCSFHLRQLAKYGFVEETGGGKGRERPWRLTSIGTEMYPDDEDAETALAAGQLSRMYFDRSVRRLQAWWAAEHAFPSGWRRATGANSTLWWVTLEELEAINKQVLEQLLFAYRERLDNPSLRPPGALPVEFVTFAAPLRLTPPAGGAQQ